MKRMWSPWRSEHIESLTPKPDSSSTSRSDDQQEADPSADPTKGDQASESGEPGGETSLFARLAESDRDADNLIVWRGEHVYVVMNRYPYNNGHLLIVPYRQVEHYDELSRAEQVAIALAIDRCIRWLRSTLQPHGFNVGMNLGEAAGAGVPEHLHAHVVPRWSGDTNFMPTTADLKVIPEAMSDTYAKLRAAAERDANDEVS